MKLLSKYIARHIPGEHSHAVAVREYITAACTHFIDKKLADPKFMIELASASSAKFWSCISEALVAQKLSGKEFGARTIAGAGPDFLVMTGSRKIWIEVVCPEPVNIPDNWLNAPLKQAINFPHNEILLRWTSAIKAKADVLIGSEDGKQKGYLNSGLVSPNDAYVIAVNGCQLRSGPFSALHGISQFPFAAEAVFPFGPYQLWLDKDTMNIVGQGYQHRPYVEKKNGAQVPAYTFLNPKFNPVSAIWAVDLNGGTAIGNREPMAVIHNPNATNPIPIGFLPSDEEYIATANGNEYTLNKIDNK